MIRPVLEAAARLRHPLPPAEPPLADLENQAYTEALTARLEAFSGHVRGETDHWRDPYGPDPVVE